MKAKEKFLVKIKSDEKFAEEIFNVDNSKEEVQRIAKEAGIEISLEEFDELVDEYVQAMDQQEGELSDDDLEAVAGGASRNAIVTTVFREWIYKRIVDKRKPRMYHKPPNLNISTERYGK